MADNDYFEIYGYPSSRVVVPHLWLATRVPVRPTARVQFEGRTAPTLHRGEARHSTWTGSAVYSAQERPDAVALMDLFESCFDGDEGRLWMHAGVDTNGGYVEAVVWVDYTEPREVGSITKVELQIYEVAG